MLEAASELHRNKLDKMGYETVRQLDEGGMGIIYKATHSVIERKAAIKVLAIQA